VVAAIAERVLQSGEHLEEERVLEIRMIGAGEEDDRDQLRAALDERPRRRARHVVELPRAREHPLARLGADVRVAVEDARDGRDGDPAELRDFVDVGDRRPRFVQIPKTFPANLGPRPAKVKRIFGAFSSRPDLPGRALAPLASTRDSSLMAEQPTGTVTFLFTDIEGSTRLLERLGAERYAESLQLHHRLVRHVVAQHGGYEVDSEGDAFFVAFDRAGDAVA